MPLSSTFMRAHPPLHDIADVNQLVRGNQEKLLEFKKFLIAYLQDIKGTRLAHGYQMVTYGFVFFLLLRDYFSIPPILLFE